MMQWYTFTNLIKREGKKERRKEGKKERLNEGTKERRNEGTKERRNEGTKVEQELWSKWEMGAENIKGNSDKPKKNNNKRNFIF